jgi:hypothetical protein
MISSETFLIYTGEKSFVVGGLRPLFIFELQFLEKYIISKNLNATNLF